jgi:GR25 family glycosyltransferase involved in LPS biosynthesis
MCGGKMKHVNIEKTFVVNLDDKIHRWEHFQKLDTNIERIPAVDSRENWFVYEDFGLELVPYGRNNDHYFTQSKGAVGCYLSHYVIWKKIIEEGLDWCLVLEDDADINSVLSFMENSIFVKNDTNVVQLNNRTQHHDLVQWFNGTTAYALDAKAARTLVNATHDFSYFESEPNELLPWRVEQHNLDGCEYVAEEIPMKYCWKVPNAIRAPADSIIGYSGHPSIDSSLRLGLEFQPMINLHDTLVESDITPSNEILHWEMSCEQLGELEQRDDFMWWTEREDFHQESVLMNRKRKFLKEPTEDSISLICVLRNECLLLPYFIEYYIKLGVTHFTFIDNGSSDGTLRYLLNYKATEIQVYRTNDSYAKNEYGVAWVNEVLNEQFKDMWCLVVDVDELLIPRNNISLGQLRDNMKHANANILVTCMVDFYPKDFFVRNYVRGQPFLDHSNVYDKMTHDNITVAVQDDNAVTVKGGVRHRITKSGVPNNDSYCITKKSFFKYDFYNSHRLSLGMHWVLPLGFTDWIDFSGKWEVSNKMLKFHPWPHILGHFKYLKPNIKEVFKERVRREEDWSGLEGGHDKKDKSMEYKEYVENFKDSFYSESVSEHWNTLENLYSNTINILPQNTPPTNKF